MKSKILGAIACAALLGSILPAGAATLDFAGTLSSGTGIFSAGEAFTGSVSYDPSEPLAPGPWTSTFAHYINGDLLVTIGAVTYDYAVLYLGATDSGVYQFLSTDGNTNLTVTGLPNQSALSLLQPSAFEGASAGFHILARDANFAVLGIGDGSATVSDSTTPLPAALPLFATGLGAFGLLGWRRKRKQAA